MRFGGTIHKWEMIMRFGFVNVARCLLALVVAASSSAVGRTCDVDSSGEINSTDISLIRAAVGRRVSDL
jgi:hypothetical protein